MGKTKECVTFHYGDLHKSWKKGQKAPKVTYASYNENEALCVVSTFNAYIERTSSWREDPNKGLLFLSYISPHKSVESSSISRWIKEVLEKAGIDTKTFKAHSTRSASTSKASSLGLSEKEILDRGIWSGKTSWQRHYQKEISSDLKNAISFQEKVLEL